MFGTIFSRVGFAKIAAALAITTLPTAAMAHHHGIDVVLPTPPGIVIEPNRGPVQPGRVWVEPVYQTVEQRQWVEPVYQTAVSRVWIEPVTTSRCDRVYIPAQYAWQEVVSYDRFGRQHCGQQQVLVSAAHYEERQSSIIVAPGHYEDRPVQTLVCAGHWLTVPVQQVVAPGHWEQCGPVVAQPARRPGIHLELRLPF